MAHPVLKTAGHDGVFEEFPLPERKHARGHAAQRDALGVGLHPEAPEASEFGIHLSRTARPHPSHPEVAAVKAPAPGGAAGRYKTSYQAFLEGEDDGLGKPARRRGKKTTTQARASNPLAGVMATEDTGLRQFAPAVHDPKTGTSRGGHVPGYQGHVPLGSKSTNTVASRSLDKSLVLENYRHNLVGYTGNRR